MEALVAEKRRELIEIVSEVDDQLAEAFLEDVPITSSDLEVHTLDCLSFRLFSPTICRDC